MLPIFILNHEGQRLLDDYRLTGISKQEINWHDWYHNSELSSGPELYYEHVYKPFFITYEEYSKYALNAAICKQGVGGATLSIWACSLLLATYQHYYKAHNGVYSKKSKKIPMVVLSNEEAGLLEFTFSRLTQERVINGIKHVQNGKADFEPYDLRNIGDKKYEDRIRKELVKDFDIPRELVDKFIWIIRFAEDNNEMTKGCLNFLSMYNKGRAPANSEALERWSSSIVDATHFGSLLKPLFDIRRQIESGINQTMSDIEALIGDTNGSTIDVDSLASSVITYTL